MLLECRLKLKDDWKICCGVNWNVNNAVVWETHNNRAARDFGILSVKIEIGLGTEKTYVAVRHVVCNGRDIDWMSLSCWKLPQNCPNP